MKNITTQDFIDKTLIEICEILDGSCKFNMPLIFIQ